MAINMKPAASVLSAASTPAPTQTASAAPAWAKKGSAANAELVKHEKEVVLTQEQSKHMWRFLIKEGEEARITFVDGYLMPEGSLDFFQYYEHSLLINNKWGNQFVCTKEIEPCPICEAGDKSAFVGALTVIDHRETKGKDGKVYKDSPRLFVAKRETLKMLLMLGAKRGGLQGCTFDVARTGDKSPSVGSMFDFIEKNTIEDLKSKYTRKTQDGKVETIFVPADYYKECAYKTADELRAAIPGLAGAAQPLGSVSQADVAALEKEL